MFTTSNSMTFNVTACVSLHNQIVSRAVEALPADSRPTIVNNWFTAYAHDLRIKSPPWPYVNLTGPLEQFLSGIDVVFPNSTHHFAFTPFLVGISKPSELLPSFWHDLGSYGDFVRLYRKPTEWYEVGLVMSLEDHQVSLIDNLEYDPADKPATDLQSTLEMYLRQIDTGKWAVDTSEVGGFGDETRCQGWRYESWTEWEMEWTLAMWDNLIEVIMDGMSWMSDAPTWGPWRSLVSQPVIDQYLPVDSEHSAVNSFVRTFLTRARKPPFRGIAPMLQIPTDNLMHHFGPKSTRRGFLLFPWQAPGVAFEIPEEEAEWRTDSESARIVDDRGGLYILEGWSNGTEAKMLLPFSIGHNGHLLRGDGYLQEGIGNDKLYHLGICNPAMPYQGTPLALVLTNWAERVVNKNWLVNVHGLTGSKLSWTAADNERLAGDFQLSLHCEPPVDRNTWRHTFPIDRKAHDEL
jgi:hypothetical protein